MEIITVHTAQNIDIDYEIGGLGERILALLIDYGFFLALLIIFSISSIYVKEQVSQIFYIIFSVLFGFYDLACETFMNGQSFGKLIMKIRVISLDGGRPKFSQYLLRWLFRLVDMAITGYLGGLVSAAMSEKGQRIGDIVAGTAVVRTRPRTKMNNLIFTQVDDTYQPVFTEVAQLNDKDVALIHEVIGSYFKTGNRDIVYNMTRRVREHLGISPLPNMNELLFLQTIIKDYSHITALNDQLINH